MKRGMMIVLVLALALSLTACGGSKDQVKTTKGDTPDNGAARFVRCVLDLKYDDILVHSNIPDKTFLSGKDIEAYIPASDYRILPTLTGAAIKEAVIANNGTESAAVNVTLQTGDDDNPKTETVLVKMVKIDKEWVPDLTDAVVTDWKIKTTGGAELSINGIQVSQSLITGHAGNYSLYDVYTIPAIGRSEAAITVKGTNFAGYTMKATPSKNSSSEKEYVDALVRLPDEDAKKAMEAIKELWNNSYNDYVSGADAAELKKYFAADADADLADNLVRYYETIRKGPADYLNIDHRITNIGFTQEGVCFYPRIDIAAINFGYKLEWVWNNTKAAHSMTRASHIYLKIENGNYKIYKITDEILFNQSNFAIDKWEQG